MFNEFLGSELEVVACKARSRARRPTRNGPTGPWRACAMVTLVKRRAGIGRKRDLLLEQNVTCEKYPDHRARRFLRRTFLDGSYGAPGSTRTALCALPKQQAVEPISPALLPCSKDRVVDPEVVGTQHRPVESVLRQPGREGAIGLRRRQGSNNEDITVPSICQEETGHLVAGVVFGLEMLLAGLKASFRVVEAPPAAFDFQYQTLILAFAVEVVGSRIDAFPVE